MSRDREETARAIERMRADECARLMRDLADPACVERRDGVLYWRRSGNIVPPFVYEDAGLPCPAVQSAAYSRHLDAALANYRKNPPRLSWEQRAEMENALGPDAIDIITGKPA